MKIKLQILLTLAFFCAILLKAPAQTNPVTITSLVSTQRAGTFFVDITYNLIDPDNQGAYILVEASSDSGATYVVPIKNLSGDVGFVPSGNNKRIVWNAFNDWAGNFTTNARVRLTADASFKGVVVNTTTNVSPSTNLVWIPSGTFVMGGSGANVYISRGFWMGRYEITQAEYVAIMTNNPSSTIGSNYPADNITWNLASSYCAIRTSKERALGLISTNWAYRLPTEAEWEYACRAGTATTYFFGDSSVANRLPFYAWYASNSGGTQPVGTRSPNRWGLYDMYGNVSEWCSDWASSSSTLPTGNVTDPQGVSYDGGFQTIFKILRGGSFIESNGARLQSGRVNNSGTSAASVEFANLTTTGRYGIRVVLAQTP